VSLRLLGRDVSAAPRPDLQCFADVDERPPDRLVSILENGKPRAVAGCSIGYATTDEPCPDPSQLDQLKPVAHWTTNPKMQVEFTPVPSPNQLWKYDPDLGQWLYDQPWMDECLTAAVFPPSELSRP
jgi:hypothetical protein